MSLRRITAGCIIVLCLSVPFHDARSEGDGAVTLDQSLTEALANNPTLKQRREEMSAVHATRWDTVLPGNPEMFMEHEGIPAGGSLSRYDERRIGLSQEIEYPTVYYHRMSRTRHEYRAASLSYAQARNEVVRDVRKSYYRVLMLRERHDLYREIGELTGRILGMAERKAEAGETTSYEVLRATVENAEAERNIITASRELTLALYELKLRLGRKRDNPVDVTGELEYRDMEIDVNRLKAAAIENHPLLRRTLSELELRKADAAIAGASLFPSLSFSLFQQRIQADDDRDAWGGEIGLGIPIWSIWKERGRIRAAAHRVEAAGWNIEREKRRVLLEVEGAANSVMLARDTILNYRTSMMQEVEEMVRMAERRYEEGEADYLELVEALRTMQRTRAGYLDILYGYLAAVADLECALGVPIDVTQ